MAIGFSESLRYALPSLSVLDGLLDAPVEYDCGKKSVTSWGIFDNEQV